MASMATTAAACMAGVISEGLKDVPPTKFAKSHAETLSLKISTELVQMMAEVASRPNAKLEERDNEIAK